MPTTRRKASRIRTDVLHADAASLYPGGGGTLFTEPVLVVRQKPKLVELQNEYAIYDELGNQLGGVREVGQSRAKKLLRVVNLVGSFLSHTLHIVDMAGSVVLVVTRDAGVKGRIVIDDAQGREVGHVVQQNWYFGKRRFDLEAGGRTIGFLDAGNRSGTYFRIADEHGDEVGRISSVQSLAGVVTTADNYVVQIHLPLEDPLLSLVVASAVCVDTALHQIGPIPG